jgi:hypothetical protein
MRRTMSSACAIAAGAATVYRNYFAAVDGVAGQTSERQLDGLADLGEVLVRSLGVPVGELWAMRNGYALCTRSGLDAIAGHLDSSSPEAIDDLRGKLRVGVHWDVDSTDGEGEPRQKVSQVFCSALPVAYTSVPPHHWQAFATLVLEAAYEATLWSAVLNARANGTNIVLLTRLGGGAFGNDDDWIDSAMGRALDAAVGFDLDVRLVSYGAAHPSMVRLAERELKAQEARLNAAITKIEREVGSPKKLKLDIWKRKINESEAEELAASHKQDEPEAEAQS